MMIYLLLFLDLMNSFLAKKSLIKVRPIELLKLVMPFLIPERHSKIFKAINLLALNYYSVNLNLSLTLNLMILSFQMVNTGISFTILANFSLLEENNTILQLRNVSNWLLKMLWLCLLTLKLKDLTNLLIKSAWNFWSSGS